jgi:flagellar biosynthesis protein FliR
MIRKSVEVLFARGKMAGENVFPVKMGLGWVGGMDLKTENEKKPKTLFLKIETFTTFMMFNEA